MDGENARDIRPPCPDCGADDALVHLGVRRHDPPLLLCWLALFAPVHTTHVYACAACDEIVLIGAVRPAPLCGLSHGP